MTAENEDSVTAVDYLHNQLMLEKQAREIMPYDPNECTYSKGELRQPLFACLTCSKQSGTEIGVCYSCSIQCHSTHELVELFTKRNFACDCGTTRLAKGSNLGCKLRHIHGEDSSRRGSGSRSNSFSGRRSLLLLAEDIPSLSNIYNQNYKGLFCCCSKPYNPLEETATMHQCFFGDVCGEDWYHEDCILGYKPGFIISQQAILRQKDPLVKPSGENLLDRLSPPGEDAIADLQEQIKKQEDETPEVPLNIDDEEEDYDDDDNSHIIGDYLPKTGQFDLFICWRCIDKYKDVFIMLLEDKEIVVRRVPHFDNVESKEEWEAQYQALNNTSDEHIQKKIKLESRKEIPYSIFLATNFRNRVKYVFEAAEKDSRLNKFFTAYEYLYKDDPVYKPPRERDGAVSSTGSLLELGTDALLSLPREQAIEGLHAYDKIRSKLRDFFKPFAEQGKVVTEEEVRGFFSRVKEEEHNV